MLQTEEITLAVGVLIDIYKDCSGGRTRIPMSNLNDIAMNILKRADLVKCKDEPKELTYYVGISEKGYNLCKVFGG